MTDSLQLTLTIVRIAVLVPLLYFLWENRRHLQGAPERVRKIVNLFVWSLVLLFVIKVYLSIDSFFGITLPPDMNTLMLITTDGIVFFTCIYVFRKINEL